MVKTEDLQILSDNPLLTNPEHIADVLIILPKKKIGIAINNEPVTIIKDFEK